MDTAARPRLAGGTARCRSPDAREASGPAGRTGAPLPGLPRPAPLLWGLVLLFTCSGEESYFLLAILLFRVASMS